MGGSEINDIEDSEEDQGVPKVIHKEYFRSSQLELALKEALLLSEVGLTTAFAVKKHSSAGYIPTEILITFARCGYGGRKCREQIALALNERIVKALSYFLRINPRWAHSFNLSSESKKEIVSTAWLSIMASKASISFGEVNFLTFIQARFLDWFISQTRLKNSAPSVDEFFAEDEDGESLSLVGQLADENAKTPEQLAELQELIDKSQGDVLTLPKKQRDAIYYHLECEYTQDVTAKLMNCTEKSVRTYLKLGLQTLKEGMKK